MRLKELFSVPEGKKVTEKVFGRVLISSVCSVLLCMACLISTTWAWFAVSIENTDNVIHIATVTPNVQITSGENVILPEGGRYALEAGTYAIGIQVTNNATESDDLSRAKGNVYVVMIVTYEGVPTSYCFTFAGNETTQQYQEIQIGSGTATVSFSASWIVPASATPVSGEAMVIGESTPDPVTDPGEGGSTETTAATELTDETIDTEPVETEAEPGTEA